MRNALKFKTQSPDSSLSLAFFVDSEAINYLSVALDIFTLLINICKMNKLMNE